MAWTKVAAQNDNIECKSCSHAFATHKDKAGQHCPCKTLGCACQLFAQ